jgi:hypothetical protein
LPPLFFPNEFYKKTPDIQFFSSHIGAELLLKFPGYQYMSWKGKVAISVEMQIDPVSLTYQLPYW